MNNFQLNTFKDLLNNPKINRDKFFIYLEMGKKINLNRSFSNVSLNENEVGRPPPAQRFNF